MVYTVLTVRYLLTCRRWRREIFPCTQQRRLSAPTCHTGRSRARYPSPSSEQCAPSLPSDHFAASGLVLKCQISTLYSILITVSLWQRIFISCWKNLFLSTNQLFTYSRLVQAKSTREGRIPSTVAGRLKCWDIFVCTFCRYPFQCISGTPPTAFLYPFQCISPLPVFRSRYFLVGAGAGVKVWLRLPAPAPPQIKQKKF